MFWKAFINKNVPVCLKCKHFIKDVNNYPQPSDILYGRCNKFGSGVIVYDNATQCREDNKKCGLFGQFYNPVKIE